MRGYLSVPLSAMTGGINRFEREAGPNQIVDGIDVISDDGDLRRRDAYRSIGQAAPHLLPAGDAYMKLGTASNPAADTYVDRPDRAGTITAASAYRIYVGCAEVFDGIDVSILTASGTVSSSKKLRCYFSTGVGTWTEMTWFRDTTRKASSAAADFLQPMMRDGTISWHRSAQISGWSSVAVDTVTRFWVRIDFVLATDAATASLLSGTISIAAPGLRAFHLVGVNGLFPVRLGSRKVWIVCSDRFDKRGQERGAQIGAISQARKATKVLRIVEDEGAGTYDRYSMPTWDDPGTISGYIGTTDRLKHLKPTAYGSDPAPLRWFNNAADEPTAGQFVGAAVKQALTAAGGSTSTSFTFTGLAAVANEFEHCLLRVTTTSGGGITTNTHRQIRAHAAGDVLTVYDAFAAAPDATNRFAILKPASRAILEGIDYEIRQHSTTVGESELILEEGRPYSPDPASGIASGALVNMELSKECRWTIDAGRRWSAAYDTITRSLVMTNGRGPVLSYDGRRLRKLSADSTSSVAEYLTGKLPDEGTSGEDEGDVEINPLSKLRESVPVGEYIVDYMGRFVIGNKQERTVYWSAPGGANNIWPRLYEFPIRDSDNGELRGLATLNDRLIAFTPTAVFDAGPPDDNGQFAFRPASQGIGFVAHAAVSKITIRGSSALIGPSADGVRIYTGAEPQEALDDYARLIEGGVNTNKLEWAVATVMRSLNWYILAVPSAGSATLNRLIVFDWVRGTWWVWSAPFDVSFLATDYSPSGKERLLIGTSDGYIQTLISAGTDDGSTVNDRARSVAVRPFGDSESSFVGITLALRDIGSTSLGIRSFVDKHETSSLNDAIAMTSGQAVWNTGVWNTATWADAREKTVRKNVPPSHGHQFQYEIRGGGTVNGTDWSDPLSVTQTTLGGVPWRMMGAVLYCRQRGQRGRRSP